MGRSVVLGMSGGIDSSAAAIRLQRAGFKVLGIFLDLHGHAEKGGAERLKTISQQLDIEIKTLVLQDLFTKQVLQPFADEYLSGRTPNPCVTCNERVKFLSLVETARSVKADFVATGHYARILQKTKGQFHLYRGRDPLKDQSYVLYRLPHDWYRFLLFPLGNHLKEENVSLGKEIFGSLFDDIPESYDLCFLPDGDRSTLTGSGKPGPIVNQHGDFIGHHKGLIWYTIGQRKGLGLPGGPWYVLKLDRATNTLIVGEKADLDVRTILVGGAVWHEQPENGHFYRAQHRYRSKATTVRICPGENDRFTVLSLKPMTGVAPGQSLVLYAEDRLVGGGFIEKTERRFVENAIES